MKHKILFLYLQIIQGLMALTEIGSNFGYVSKSTKPSPKFEAHLLGKDLFKSTKVKKTKYGNSYFG